MVMRSRSFSVCVYCGSRDGIDPAFATAAEEFGRVIGDEGWRLVYGAGDVGLMGRTARAAQAAGAETFGVIPEHLLAREVGKRDLTRCVVTETMHERKKVMVMNADAVVVLPGGPGTLDEFFEVLTWRQLGLHDKPILILDVAGYWAPLRALLDQVVAQGFAAENISDLYGVVTSVTEARDALIRAASRLSDATV